MVSMTFGSVCSGIEAASVAWHPLGWRAAWLAEIEPFPSAVLKHHYPEVPNLGDMTALPDLIRAGQVKAPDMFCGGTPCQAFSIAGLRRSLEDTRGNLSLTFCEIADAIDDVRRSRGDAECIVFWENVPGVLSTKDNAFGCFLGALAGCDSAIEPLAATGWTDAGVVDGPRRAVAWRLLDAQYFGLAQRRRRVFVVASARDGFDPAAVLFEWDGLRRDSAPSREAGEATARGTARSVALRGREGGATAELGDEVQNCLRASSGGGDKAHVLAFGGNNQAGPIDVATARNACASASGRMDFETETFLVQPTHTLRGEGFDASEDGTGRGTPLVPVAFHPTQDPISSTDGTTHCIGTGSSHGSATVAVGVQAEYYSHDYCHDRVYSADGISPALNCSQDHTIRTAMQVRRLTPVECERLQGFPDGYTAIPWRKKPASECPDGPRYKALGNSWAVPVVHWIGKRIDDAVRAGR